jgi:hypothetical protein
VWRKYSFNTNNQTGGFGIGAKSAFAYTDSFTVVSHYNGTAFHYVAHVTTDFCGTLDLITQNPTSEPNGTEIQIAIQSKDLESFCDAVERAIQYWDPKEFPKVDGFERAATLDRLGNFEIVSGVARGLLLVIDGIPYSIPHSVDKKDNQSELTYLLGDKVTGLLHFKTGEIDIAANRESITNCESNQNAIRTAMKQAIRDIKAMLKKSVTSQKTLEDALDTHRELSRNYNHSEDYELQFNGDSFTLNTNGGLISELFSGIIVREYSTSSDYYSRRSRLRISGEKPSSVDFRLNGIYWTDDITSHANQNRRIKAAGEDVVLLCADPNSPELKRLAMHLGIAGTSSLGPASVRRSVKKESTADVVINHYVKETSRQTISKVVSLDRNRQTDKTVYVYAVREDADDNSSYKSVNALMTRLGLSFALVNKATQKKIAGDSYFVSFEDFCKNARKYMAKDKWNLFLNTFKKVIARDDYYSDDAHCFELYRDLAKCRLKDRALKRALQVVSDIDTDKAFSFEYRQRPSLTDKPIAALVKAVPELALYTVQCAAIIRFKKQYVLFKACKDSIYNRVKAAPALAVYLNTVYRKGN